MNNTNSRIRKDSKSLKSMNKEYNELQSIKKNANSKNGSKLAKSRVSTVIRNYQINSLRKKMNATKASIKEDHQIKKELDSYEKAARIKAKNIARTKAAMQKAKAQFKSDKKEYSKAYDKYAKPYNNLGIFANVTKKQKARNEANANYMLNKAEKANESRKKYKKAKNAYKRAKI